MMKRASKILALLLVAVMMLTLLPHVAFAAPPQDDATHKHNWVLTSEKKATCTQKGSKTWTCSACKKTYTESAAALGHKWDSGKVSKEATCEQDGVRTYTCSR